MMIENDITPFESVILGDVIDLYIETGKPVSSRMLKSRFNLSASSANIRNHLHELESKRYIFKPHISAGRVPSDKGYRWYVDNIRKTGLLSRKMKEEIRSRIGNDWGDMREIMHRTSKLIGEMTDYMGLMMGIYQSLGHVRNLRIVQQEHLSGLIVLMMIDGTDRKVPVEFPKRYSPFVLDRAVQIINERVAGFPLEEAQRRIENFLKESAGVEREIAGLISSNAEYLFDWAYDLEYHFKGMSSSIAMVEVSDTILLRGLVRIMGEKTLMLNLMRSRMSQDMMVTIGRENLQDELEAFSIVTKRFSTGECDGLVGILGPTRMSYGLVLSLLNSIEEEFRYHAR